MKNILLTCAPVKYLLFEDNTASMFALSTIPGNMNNSHISQITLIKKKAIKYFFRSCFLYKNNMTNMTEIIKKVSNLVIAARKRKIEAGIIRSAITKYTAIKLNIIKSGSARVPRETQLNVKYMKETKIVE
jgi:hypothetical protein